MQALDVLDHALLWETERQNRLHNDALQAKKKQRVEETRREAKQTGAAHGAALSSSVLATQELGAEWSEKLHRIPEMRSALIPLDEELEGAEWSRPFSLPKADMEPWISFMRGYNASRLFLDAAPASKEGGPVIRLESQIDHPVRALLELKHVPLKIILEPPVQINRQLEYQDVEAELHGNREKISVQTILKGARDVHERQLEKAVAMGRSLGDTLHDALMGEGHVNLIKAWEKNFRRKPRVDELHLMLTTGRVGVEPRRRASPAAAPFISAAGDESVSERSQAMRPNRGAAARERPADTLVPSRTVPASAVGQEAVVSNLAKRRPDEESAQSADANVTPSKARKTKKILWYLLHAGVCSAAIVAYLWLA